MTECLWRSLYKVEFGSAAWQLKQLLRNISKVLLILFIYLIIKDECICVS